MQIIKQTDEEKMAMYMKMPKKKIAEMLIQCNKVLDEQYGAKQIFVQPDVIKSVCDKHDWQLIAPNSSRCRKCGAT